ncbi:NAD(P)-dependent alcohol dehydrogenase [Hyphomonas oceanitis]|uniref:NAD(P)-dependent alcohol dehydrogenase n=1 Tax=Hyphomonas oceanitis TaxID=81033 RepID=UPI003002AFA2
MQVAAYAAKSPEAPVEPLEITRRDLQPNDVLIDITWCGVCHSDIHTARNEWGRTKYPIVPGHEIVGTVSATGANVRKHKVGDTVGVGCLVDACLTCGACHDGDEQYCEKGSTGTYGGTEPVIGGQTHGGYSKQIVVRDEFVLKVSDRLNPAEVAPLLCAGITSWSPLKHWNVKAGDKVGVIGLGGLGHMGVKFAVAMGCEVVMITTSEEKGTDAKRLGAHDVLVSTDRDAMKAQRGSFDFLLNTVPVKHDLNPYLMLLGRNGTMVIVGAIEPLEPMHGGLLLSGRKRVAGSGIGGIAETQEMLDFCAEHGVTSDIEVIAMKDINAAYDRVVKGDVKYRFVIDMATL